jgi:hypothetical protein
MNGTAIPVRLERRLLAGSGDGRLDSHLAEHGRPPALDRPRLIGLLRDAGLTGRGGPGSRPGARWQPWPRPAGPRW